MYLSKIDGDCERALFFWCGAMAEARELVIISAGSWSTCDEADEN